uniref:Fibronectin type-III domain-containing protein n=1 Tax=Panagrolaimus sp. PS1159 TaxID=55785 RepID=A0AC35EWH3_9BILA
TKNFEEPLGPLIIYKPRGFVASGQNVRLQWGLPSNHPQLRNLVNFDVELRKGSTEQNWIHSDIEVQAHVRAVTVRNLIPNNRYQFRIVGNLLNKTKVYKNNNAQSPISKIRFAKTLEEKWLTNPEIEKDERDKTTWQFFRENYLFPPNQSVTRFVAVVILSAVVV